MISIPIVVIVVVVALAVVIIARAVVTIALAVITMPAIVKILAVAVVLKPSAAMPSTVTTPAVEGEYDRRRLRLLLAKVTEDLVRLGEAILELLLELLHQRDLGRIQLGLIAVLVVAREVQVDFPVRVCHF